MPNDIANNMADTIQQLEKELKNWKEEYANLNKISYGFYKELKEAKRLLKMAVNDMRDVANNSCCSRCVFDELYIQGSCCAEGCFKWRYADEALKLIGDEK